MIRFKNNIAKPTALLLSAALAACATTPSPSAEAAPAFVPATLADEKPTAIEIVEVPKPLPLPGQLKPRPRALAAAKAETGAPAVLSGTTAARVEPDSGRFLNAI